MPENIPMGPSQSHHPGKRKTEILLWFGVMAPPVAWGLRLMIAYPLVHVACALQSNLSIHLVSLATAVLSVVGGIVSWRSWQRLTEGNRSFLAGPRSRPEFMAISGVVFAVYFLALIVLEWSSTFFINPCLAGL